ncbi:4,5-DOPA dioxygenase extradiol [Youngiibacter fragilis]|uniref:Aromatic ring-cleaving dioxygenase n=1 Tax=Youngiibacter fragilis 232.1 TaxID=994573 RepID=V7HZ76_9CLOT|nr:4,5-DOPA dioxygenase extradiol [Youngiibacter fragilis]ETA78928.1 aromatic ring-cleaving dioxygenase [Youngiibacter fragilis 232.1]
MEKEMRMPAIFAGHGSPMNAILDNEYTKTWEKLGREIGKPKLILSVSAHWYTHGTLTSDLENPKQIYDMYGFPEELYRLRYEAKGSKTLSGRIIDLLGEGVTIDNSWGIDHGTWSVLCKMYPEADIPVVQLSIDADSRPERHYEIGRILSGLRDEGVMIFGSGNIVHNLGRIRWDMDGGEDWAVEFDGYIRDRILTRDHTKVVDYRSAGKSQELSFRTLEHYRPLLYVLGASRDDDEISIFNESCTMGSISMTGYMFR